MNITLNGRPVQVQANATVADLLAAQGQAERRVAVEVNHAIVPRSAHASHRLAENDQVEVVTAFGGG